MSFPVFIKRKFLAELRDRADDGRKSPTDHEIKGLLDLWTDEQVKSLLAELSEAGEITVRWTRDGREIVQGKVEARTTARPRPIASMPTSARPDIVASRRHEPKSEEYPGASGTARKASGASVLADAKRIEDRAPPAKGREVMEAPPAPPHNGEWEKIGKTIDAAREPRPAKAKAPTTHPVLLKLEPGIYAALSDEARRLDLRPTSHIRSIVEQAVNGSPPRDTAIDKLRLPADISRAFGHQPLPLYDFLIEAMRLGITVMAETRREEARAA